MNQQRICGLSVINIVFVFVLRINRAVLILINQSGSINRLTFFDSRLGGIVVFRLYVSGNMGKLENVSIYMLLLINSFVPGFANAPSADAVARGGNEQLGIALDKGKEPSSFQYQELLYLPDTVTVKLTIFNGGVLGDPLTDFDRGKLKNIGMNVNDWKLLSSLKTSLGEEYNGIVALNFFFIDGKPQIRVSNLDGSVIDVITVID